MPRGGDDGRRVISRCGPWRPRAGPGGMSREAVTSGGGGAGREAPLSDVRGDRGLAAGRGPGAVSIPMSRRGEGLGELPDGACDVICQAGGRSAQVVTALEARGYDATNVAGGTGEWVDRGFEVER